MKNLLIVIADSLRADDGLEACAALRQNAVTYTNAWVHGSATYPSFPSIWTGLEVHEHAAVRAPLAPRDMGLVGRLRDAGYMACAISENPYTAWAMGLANVDPTQHGMTVDDWCTAPNRLPEPWAYIYHSMYCHWPYKFDVREFPLPVGWPAEHPEVAPEQYHAAYRRGVQGFVEGLSRLIDHLQPGATILTSDHGEAFMEHGTYLHDPQRHWAETLHVPLIVCDGGRKYTDNGLLGLKHFPEIVLAAGRGKRVRAKDEFVRVEDYHGDCLHTLVYPDGTIEHGAPDCPPFDIGAAYEVVEPMSDEDEAALLERLRVLGYA